MLLVLGMSCKQEEAQGTASEESAAQTLSSSAAVEKTDSGRKFIRTADIKFKVKDVTKSTYSVENTVSRFGGFVTSTDLQSKINEKKRTKISADSLIEVTRFTVANNMTIRVPNVKLDTVLKTISREVGYLDHRVIKADDVSLTLLANQMSQNRNGVHRQRLTNAIDKKGQKLGDISNAENDLLDKEESSDNSGLANMALNDQVNFSTLTLQLYQNEMVRKEAMANIDAMSPRPNLGFLLADSIRSGLEMVEAIVVFALQFWGLILVSGGSYFIYRKYVGKKRIVA